MVIVAFNAGKWTEQDCPATAVARALGLTPSQVKSACNRDNRRDWLDIWRVTLEKLSALVAERGGRPIVENGHSMLEMPAATDVLRNNRDILEQLYSEVPQQLKDRHQHVAGCYLTPFVVEGMLLPPRSWLPTCFAIRSNRNRQMLVSLGARSQGLARQPVAHTPQAHCVRFGRAVTGRARNTRYRAAR